MMQKTTLMLSFVVLYPIDPPAGDANQYDANIVSHFLCFVFWAFLVFFVFIVSFYIFLSFLYPVNLPSGFELVLIRLMQMGLKFIIVCCLLTAERKQLSLNWQTPGDSCKEHSPQTNKQRKTKNTWIQKYKIQNTTYNII